MLRFLYLNFKKGIEKIKGNPQLIYTIIVALLIASSFVFMAERFISIANDAQERLISVRIGSLQDAFVSFAGEKIDDPTYLNGRISQIMAANETIRNFKIVARNASGGYIVLASNDEREINQEDEEISFFYNLSKTKRPAYQQAV